MFSPALLQGGGGLRAHGWHSGSSSSSSSMRPFGGSGSDPLLSSPLARLFGGLVSGLADDLEVGGGQRAASAWCALGALVASRYAVADGG
jgi:hypothetical protein